MRKASVLLVDDHPFVLEGIRSFLSDLPDFEVVAEASSGAEALKMAEEHEPDFILLDINMPKKNGFEVLRWLRADPMAKRLSVTMLTASLRPEDVDLAFELGANSYLVKPSNLESLAEMLRTLRDWIAINHFAAVTAGNGVTIELTPGPGGPGMRMTTPLPPTNELSVGF